jgi:hypothetical protein
MVYERTVFVAADVDDYDGPFINPGTALENLQEMVDVVKA